MNVISYSITKLQYNLTVSSVVKSLDLTASRARILEECKLEHGFQLQSMIMNKRHQRKKYMQNLFSHIYALHYQKQLRFILNWNLEGIFQ